MNSRSKMLLNYIVLFLLSIACRYSRKECKGITTKIIAVDWKTYVCGIANSSWVCSVTVCHFDKVYFENLEDLGATHVGTCCAKSN